MEGVGIPLHKGHCIGNEDNSRCTAFCMDYMDVNIVQCISYEDSVGHISCYKVGRAHCISLDSGANKQEFGCRGVGTIHVNFSVGSHYMFRNTDDHTATLLHKELGIVHYQQNSCKAL